MAQKTVTMAINDTKTSLVQIINNSGLNYAINELILRDLLIQCHDGAQKEYDQDLQKYNADLAEEERQVAEESEVEDNADE